jgi:hypothetical protein
MNTRLIMTISAITLGLTGITLTFLPNEISSLLRNEAGRTDAVILQLLGAGYFAFAMVNWTAKGNLIGGIYARPVAIGNLTHFVVGALAATKAYLDAYETLLLPVALVYIVFALAFSVIFFTHPAKATTG